jgi:hypothetical protein
MTFFFPGVLIMNGSPFDCVVYYNSVQTQGWRITYFEITFMYHVRTTKEVYERIKFGPSDTNDTTSKG